MPAPAQEHTQPAVISAVHEPVYTAQDQQRAVSTDDHEHVASPRSPHSDGKAHTAQSHHEPPKQANDAINSISHEEASIGIDPESHYGPDPYGLATLKNTSMDRPEIKSSRSLWKRSRVRKVESFYEKQNEFIDELLQSGEEERLQVEDQAKNGGKVRFAVNASFAVNFCLFIIQMFAAVSTGSLSLFATAADAFMDLVSSVVMLITSRLANKPNPVKYPVGRRRIETIGIILFCALMTTVAVQLIVESARALGEGSRTDGKLQLVPLICVALAIGAKFLLFCYCFIYRRYPAAHVFFIDHRNDLVVNVFGLTMSIVGEQLVWYLDPIGAMCIGFLILFSWVAQAFDQVWLLVGKSATREFINKVIYVTITHDPRIRKVDTCRAYHAGEHLYVEVDIVMDPDIPLRHSHDVGQTLQRKLEGLADVERAFVHVDYEHEHNVWEEHKPLYEPRQPRSFKQMLAQLVRGD
ncbi:cation efflux family-domain-containing protein [Macrophomina phaseolina]|uniref:Cation efflux family-domain-containing protein n=1 Tax=Macrophomina phaseolina TaxID=35725 RepID=A0ABQ8G6J0_9PEZI|nr:cation efflux family-domain-containing protein [Macrophomina phaseolina]